MIDDRCLVFFATVGCFISVKMDCGACESKDLSPTGVRGEGAVDLSKMGNGKTLLEPITPVPNRETADSPFDCKKSPLTAAKIPTKASCFDSESSGSDGPVGSVGSGDDTSPQTPRDGLCVGGERSPRTPREVVFDPFAPGPEHLAMAPLNKRYNNQVRSSVARRLAFEFSLRFDECDRSDDVELITDEEMFESVYNNLLEAIVLKQTESFLAEASVIEWDSDSYRTPSPPYLTGIAETCPGAPMKSSAVSRKIDLGLVRKLEF